MLTEILAIFTLVAASQAKYSFPIPTVRLTERVFRDRSGNRNLRWDQSNYLTDLSGPLTVCERVTQWGRNAKKVSSLEVRNAWTAASIPQEQWPLIGLFSAYYFPVRPITGAFAGHVDSDITSLIMRTFSNDPTIGAVQTNLLADLSTATRFGCSVEPGCILPESSYTVVVCILAHKAPEIWVQGFNETWGAHAHDAYKLIQSASHTMGREFPAYHMLEDELLWKNTLSSDICGSLLYTAGDYEKRVGQMLLNNFNQLSSRPSNVRAVGWYFGISIEDDATSSDFIKKGAYNEVTPMMKGVIKSITTNGTLAASSQQNYDAGACVMAVCPNRVVPDVLVAKSGGQLQQGEQRNLAAIACYMYVTACQATGSC